MKLLRYLLLLSGIGLSISVVQAQDNAPLMDGNSLTLPVIVTGIIIVIVVLLWVFRRNVSVPQEHFINTSVLTPPDDQTEQYLLDHQGPTRLEIPDKHLPVDRPDGDLRPYLVFAVRQSSVVEKDSRLIITPDETPFIIGSRAGCNFQIDDRYVSGTHLHIEFSETANTYILIDRNSSNGTYWNGETMVKKSPYAMKQARDVTLEIAVNHVFSVYLDMPEELTPDEASPFEEKTPPQVDLPVPTALPAGVVGHLDWKSPEIQKEQYLKVTGTITTIGRGDDAIDVRINHDLVSKLHAYLVWKDNQFWLIDMSSNGTWLTADSQAQSRLERGAYVPLLADTSFTIEVASNAVQVKFRYKILEDEFEPYVEEDDEDATDKLPELPEGLRPLFHIVRDGDNEQRREFRISTSIITIGQDETNIVCVPSLSDMHAQIIWSEDKFWYEDLSRTGFTLNNRRIRRAKVVLEPGEIYYIRLNERQPDEIEFAFYYKLPQTDTEDDSVSSVQDVEHTQPLDNEFS